MHRQCDDKPTFPATEYSVTYTYNHYIGLPVLTASRANNLRILLQQTSTARMPLQNLDLGEDAQVLLNRVICTVAVS